MSADQPTSERTPAGKLGVLILLGLLLFETRNLDWRRIQSRGA